MFQDLMIYAQLLKAMLNRSKITNQLKGNNVVHYQLKGNNLVHLKGTEIEFNKPYFRLCMSFLQLVVTIVYM